MDYYQRQKEIVKAEDDDLNRYLKDRDLPCCAMIGCSNEPCITHTDGQDYCIHCYEDIVRREKNDYC